MMHVFRRAKLAPEVLANLRNAAMQITGEALKLLAQRLGSVQAPGGKIFQMLLLAFSQTFAGLGPFTGPLRSDPLARGGNLSQSRVHGGVQVRGVISEAGANAVCGVLAHLLQLGHHRLDGTAQIFHVVSCFFLPRMRSR
jgi:hypothetical protein